MSLLAAWRTPIEQLLAASGSAVSAVGVAGTAGAGATGGEVRAVTLDATVAEAIEYALWAYDVERLAADERAATNTDGGLTRERQ